MAFKMKGMNHGKNTGSAYKKKSTDDDEILKVPGGDGLKINASTGEVIKPSSKKTSAEELSAKLNKNLQDYEIPQGEYTAERPYEAADIGKGRQVGIFNPVKPRFDFSKVDYGRGGKPRTEWKKHTTEELAQIIKDKPHRFGGWDPVKDAGRMDEILRPSKIAYADKYGKWRGGKAVRYEYGDRVRFHGISPKDKAKILAKQKARQEADKARKSQYVSPSSSTKKDGYVHPMDRPDNQKTGKFAPKGSSSGMKFGRKYKK